MARNRLSGRLGWIEKEVLTEIAQQHEFEISLGSNRRHMELPEYRAAIQESEAVQEQTASFAGAGRYAGKENGVEGRD